MFCDVMASVLYRKMYEDTKMRVLSPNGETDLFEILTGVLQGNIISFCLVVIVLDYALSEAIEDKEEELLILEKSRSRRVGPKMCLPFYPKKLTRLKNSCYG